MAVSGCDKLSVKNVLIAMERNNDDRHDQSRWDFLADIKLQLTDAHVTDSLGQFNREVWRGMGNGDTVVPVNLFSEPGDSYGKASTSWCCRLRGDQRGVSRNGEEFSECGNLCLRRSG
jgi:hypothetical protein